MNHTLIKTLKKPPFFRFQKDFKKKKKQLQPLSTSKRLEPLWSLEPGLGFYARWWVVRHQWVNPPANGDLYTGPSVCDGRQITKGFIDSLNTSIFHHKEMKLGLESFPFQHMGSG
jgi:hypothetical protein